LPEWLVERGIGETRAALVADGEIVEARVELDGAAATPSQLPPMGVSICCRRARQA
jgi:hypothetical protein